jgi:hypothetical protein
MWFLLMERLVWTINPSFKSSLIELIIRNSQIKTNITRNRKLRIKKESINLWIKIARSTTIKHKSW